MAIILSQITVGDHRIMITDGVPNTGAGITAEIGSIIIVAGNAPEGAIYLKTGANDTDWKVSTVDKVQLDIDLAALQDNIDAEQAARILQDAATLASANSYTDGAVAAANADISGLQDELDATQAGAGLNTGGTYSAPLVSNYLGAATSLKDADSKLDAQVKVVADALAQEVLDRAADVNAEESARIAADLTFLKLDGSRPMAAALDMNDYKIENVHVPSNPNDAATKQYVDDLLAGLSWKESVHTATVASENINIANPGTDTIGGHALTAGQRVLIKDQTDAKENGIYVFDSSSTPLVRSTDADAWAELEGAVVYVEQGTNGGGKFVATIPPTGTIGVDNITFAVFSAASALDGIGQADKVAVWSDAHTITYATTSLTEINYVAGVTSGIQGQIDAEEAARIAEDALKLNLSGGIMSGLLNMGNNKITNLVLPLDAQDAANKIYVDDKDALKVAKAGDTMTGNLVVESGDYTTTVGNAGIHINNINSNGEAILIQNQNSPITDTRINAGSIVLGDTGFVSFSVTGNGISFTGPSVNIAEYRPDGFSISNSFGQTLLFEGKLTLADTNGDPLAPTDPAHAANKAYVDAADAALSGRLDTLELDPVTKSYVDAADAALQGQINAVDFTPYLKHDGSVVMTGDLDFGGNDIKDAASIYNYNQGTSQIEPVIDLVGRQLMGFNSGSATWGGKIFFGGDNPTVSHNNAINPLSSEIATAQFVTDTANAKVEDQIVDGVTTKAPSQNAVHDALALKLDLAGGYMTGSIDMGNNDINSVDQVSATILSASMFVDTQMLMGTNKIQTGYINFWHPADPSPAPKGGFWVGPLSQEYFQVSSNGELRLTAETQIWVSDKVIANVADGVDAKDVATKGQLDSVESALDGRLTTAESDIAAIQGDYGVAGGLATLDGGGKVPLSQLPNSIMQYQGVWDASTNTPALSDGAGNADYAIGDVYRVSVAGSHNLGSGVISFEVGDYVILNASKVWEKSDTTDAVATVNGYTGNVVLDAADLKMVSKPLQTIESELVQLQLNIDAADSALDLRLDALEADPVTKAYVDAADATFLKLDGSRAMTAALNMGTHKISNVVDPNLAQDAATKAYVDAEDATFLKMDGSRLISGDLKPVNTFTYSLGDSSKAFVSVQTGYIALSSINSATISMLDQSIADANGNASILWNDRKLKSSSAADMLDWSTAGVLDAKTNKISNVGTPTASADAANKSYVDAKVEDQIVDGVTTKAPSQNAVHDALVLKLDLAGGTMSGDINMGNNDLVNASTLAIGAAAADTVLHVQENGVKYNMSAYALQTTDGTQTTIASIAVDDNSVMLLKVMVTGLAVAVSTTGLHDSVSYERTVRVKKVSGTLGLGTIQADYTSEDSSLAACSIDIQAVSGSVAVKVSGVNGKSINWKAVVEKVR